MAASIDDLAGLELDLRMKRARTVNEQVSARQDVMRARRDPAFRARLAEIVSQGQYQSGPWGKAQLGLAAASAAPLASLLPVIGSALGPIGTAVGGLGAAGLMGLGGANIREGMQRRREGLPGGGLQMGLGAADILLSPLGTGIGGWLKRGLRGATGRPVPRLGASTRMGPGGPSMDSGGPRVVDPDYSVEVVPQGLLSRGTPTGAENVGGVWHAPGRPQPLGLPPRREPFQALPAPGAQRLIPTRAASLDINEKAAQRVGGAYEAGGREPTLRERLLAKLAGSGPDPASPPPTVAAQTRRRRKRPLPVSPQESTLAGQVEPPVPKPVYTAETAAKVVTNSAPPTPAPVALAQIREELQGAGVGTAQLGFLENFLSQVDDIGEPALRALREAALDTPESRRAQTILMDRLIRSIPAQDLPVSRAGKATPKLRASMAHLFAGGGGGGQANVPGGLLSPSAGRTVIPAGAINPATGEVTEQALLRGQMPGTKRSFGLGHKGVTAPTGTMDAFKATVGGTSPEWREAAEQVKGLITEGMTPAQINAVTGYQVAFNRLHGLKRYIQRVIQFDPKGQRGAGGQFREVRDKELIGDLVKTQGTAPRTIYRDLRDLARKVAKGEVTTKHMQKTIDQINKTALQLLGVIGSIEMARRALAPEQTPNAPLT